jgi:rare lipoprotein A
VAFLFAVSPALGQSTGVASMYSAAHHGRKTASGERFNMQELTAAHRTLPFGTRVKVCRETCVVVRINDRGPFVRGRLIDLSGAAAKAIGVSGVGKITMLVEHD